MDPRCIRLFGGDAGERKKIIRYINKNGLAQYVQMPGEVDRKYIPSILKQMDFAVCTSKSENSPHAIMEPMFAATGERICPGILLIMNAIAFPASLQTA